MRNAAPHSSLAPRSSTREVLVCERKPLWTAECQRYFLAAESVAVRWVPSFPELLRELSHRERCREGCIVVLVIEQQDPQALEQIAPLSNRRNSKLMVLSAGEDPCWEWIARELGADVLLPDTVEKRQATLALQRLLSPDPTPLRPP